MAPRSVAVIILAAGRSTRFDSGGAHKMLASVGGSSVIRRSVSNALEASVGDVVVVTGADSFEAALAGLPVRLVTAVEAAQGMSASLRTGVEAVKGSVDAIVVALADQPTMRPEAYRRVVSAWITSGAAIVSPRYLPTPVPAHPTLFAASVLDELIGLTGDVGARSVIARDPSRVTVAEMEWPAPRDIDTVADLMHVEAELRQSMDARSP